MTDTDFKHPIWDMLRPLAIIVAPYLVISAFAWFIPPQDSYIKTVPSYSSGEVSYFFTSNKKVIAKHVPLVRQGMGGITIDTLAETSKEYQELIKTPEYMFKRSLQKNYFMR